MFGIKYSSTLDEPGLKQVYKATKKIVKVNRDGRIKKYTNETSIGIANRNMHPYIETLILENKL